MNAGFDGIVPVVLVADDDAVCRFFCRQSLAPFGHRVLESCNGKDAVQQALSTRPRIILIDFCLPDMSGCEVTAGILQSWPGAITESRLIGMTADLSPQASTKLLAAGCIQVLTKPFRAEKLLEAATGCPSRATIEPRSPDHGNQPAIARFVSGSFPAVKPGLHAAFLGELKRQLPELDLAVTALDWDQAANVLHRITGSASLAGYAGLSGQARALLRHLRKRECSARLAENYLDLLAQATELVRRFPAPAWPGFNRRE